MFCIISLRPQLNELISFTAPGKCAFHFVTYYIRTYILALKNTGGGGRQQRNQIPLKGGTVIKSLGTIVIGDSLHNHLDCEQELSVPTGCSYGGRSQIYFRAR